MKKIMITGANRGLGYELVRKFHDNGNELYPVVRSSTAANELKEEFKSRIFPIVADVGLDESEEIINNALKSMTEKIDILINNAGNSGTEPTIEKTTTKEILDLFNVHCLGVVRVTKGALEFLEASDSPNIINVSSRLASLEMTHSGMFAHLNIPYSYHIAKAAQNMLSVCLHQELFNDGKGIRVNSIHPGKLKTGRQAAADADMTAEQGAENIYNWILQKGYDVSGTFGQPGVAKFEW